MGQVCCGPRKPVVHSTNRFTEPEARPGWAAEMSVQPRPRGAHVRWDRHATPKSSGLNHEFPRGWVERKYTKTKLRRWTGGPQGSRHCDGTAARVPPGAETVFPRRAFTVRKECHRYSPPSQRPRETAMPVSCFTYEAWLSLQRVDHVPKFVKRASE